jgi:acyl-CoA reductase-like NAD-dependent aldehyde dehydrogenase
MSAQLDASHNSTRAFDLLIDGRLVAGASKLDVINPATGQVFARCARADRALLDEAVAAARRAFQSWSRTGIHDRRVALRKIADALAARQDEFARVLTSEQTATVATFEEATVPAGFDTVHVSPAG